MTVPLDGERINGREIRQGKERGGVDAVLLRWRNALFVIFWLCGFMFASWASRVPTLRDLLNASTSQMGILLFGLAAGAVLGLLASSHVISRLGTNTTLLFFLSATSAGLVLIGLLVSFTPALLILILALLFFGVGVSICDVAMNLSAAANERQIGKTLMPMYHAAFSIGTMLGAGFGALLEHFGVPLGVHLVGVGIAAAVTSRIAVRFLQPAEHSAEADAPAAGHTANDPRAADDRAEAVDLSGAKLDAMADPLSEPPSSEGWRTRMAVWRDPRILIIGVIVLGMAFAEGSANDWLGMAMVDGYDISNAAGAATFGVFVTAMTLGRLFGGKVLDRFGRVPVLRGTAACAVVGLVLVILGPNMAIALVGVVLWGLGASLGFPVGMSAAADDPKTATASVAAVATVGYFAFLIGPPLIGFLGERIGLLNAFWAVAILVVIAGLCSPAAREPIRRS